MRIEHLAIWASDIELLKDFYATYFGGKANNRYENAGKKFSSYFISFDEGCRLEIMQRADVTVPSAEGDRLGITHLAFSVGGKDKVILLTERLRADGYTIASEPRTTGDGYFESLVLDPEGNRIEITE